MDEYRARFGNHFSSDNAAQMFPEYDATPETRGLYRRAVGGAARAVSEEAFRQRVENADPQDVRFVAGGSGAGKSSLTRRLLAEGNIVHDDPLGDFGDAKSLMDHVLENRHDASVHYVHRDPVDAFPATLERAGKPGPDEGRVVPADVHARIHQRSADTIQRLAAEYADSPVSFKYQVHSSDAPARPGTLDDIRNTDYTGLQERLRNVLEQQRAEGRIPEGLYRQALTSARSEEGPAGEEGEGVGPTDDGGPEPPFPSGRGGGEPPGSESAGADGLAPKPDLSIDSAVNEAASKLAELRERGRSIADARVRPDVFGDDVSPEAKELLQVAADSERSGRDPHEVLDLYQRGADAVQDPANAHLFDETGPPTKADVLDAAVERAEEERVSAPRRLCVEDTSSPHNQSESQAEPNPARLHSRFSPGTYQSNGLATVLRGGNPPSQPEKHPSQKHGDKNLSTFFSIPSILYRHSQKVLHAPVLLFNQERIFFT